MVRYAAAVPAFRVSVEIVWFALKKALLTPVLVRPTNDKVLNVFAPVIVIVAAEPASVKATLLKVSPPDAIPVVAAVKLI